MPAPKKHSSVRRRANRATTAAVLNANGSATIAPKLPDIQDKKGNPVDWHPHVLAWWSDLWAAPMSAEYHDSDRHQLFMLARLMHEYWLAPDVRLLAEIRLQRAAFGLTPIDRRRLEWTIETVETAKRRGTQARRASSPQPKPEQDPRNVLRGVK